jgi:DNA replication protein DnaC/molybdopterin/thiamine biosynthesis adenylyltransferase
MKLSDDQLDALLKRLHLASARRIWPKLVEQAEKDQWSYRDFLGILVAEEIAHRQQTRLQRLSRRAVFPFLKTIDDFDFTYQSTLRLSLLGSALSSDFITEGRCLILSGKPGRGKTHLAVAIAYRAIQNGFDAVFTTAAQLIDELSAAFRAGGLAAALAPYTHPALLVVDEVGYLTYGTDAANMLFHVVNDRHKRKRSMIFTTNKSPNAWGRVLHDEDLAQAIVDRVLERGRLLTLDGPSIRTKHLGLDDAQAGASNQGVNDSARISGIPVPEFPEPTMATIRIPEGLHTRVHRHLFSSPGEHFAFLLARHTFSAGRPIFIVEDAVCVPDDDTRWVGDGLIVEPQGYVPAINAAVRAGAALIEAHNHGGQAPRFSVTDRKGLAEFAPYVLSSIPGHPYAATVWGDSTIYGEFVLPDGTTGRIRSVTTVGDRLRQLVSREDDRATIEATFDRQLPWFTEEGQRELGRLRVAVIGLGGTGSPSVQNLAYLGVRDFVLVDHDSADETSMNRLVTAAAADLGTPKAILARRLIKSIAPQATVQIFATKVQAHEVLDALKGVDVLFGCVDNDGPRLILNEFSLAYGIPYFDLAVGIEVNAGRVTEAGARVCAVVPGGPCLYCMGQIDRQEAAFFLSNPTEQALQIERGYVRGLDVKAPAVVSLNASAAATAANEFAMFVSGVRPVAPFLEVDLLGVGRMVKSQWLTPRRVKRNPGCVQCTLAGLADRASVERYAS